MEQYISNETFNSSFETCDDSNVIADDDITNNSIRENQTNDHKRNSVTITSFFEKRKVIRPAPLSENQLADRVKDCDAKVSSMQSKFSRTRRKISATKKRNVNSSSEKSASDLTNSQPSQPNLSPLPVSTVDNEKALDTTSFSSKSTSVKKKPISYRHMTRQSDKIREIQFYDRKYGTVHAEYLKATPYGLHCDVCNGDFQDLSSMIRYDKDTGLLIQHCHIGSLTHKAALERALKNKIRQPALVTLLEDITPTLPQKVKDFRYDLTKLLLCLKVSMRSANSKLLHNFVNNYVGPVDQFLTDRSNLSKEYIPKLLYTFNKERVELLKDQYINVQLDSTYRVGDWYGFVFRCVTSDFKIVMRPVLKRMEGHLKEKDGKNELSSLLIHVVYDLWNYHQLRFLPNALPPDMNHRLVSISGDRVSINRFAFMNAHIYLSFPKSLFIDCHSHTLNNCGKKLDESCRYQFRFWERHLAVFARSSDTRHHWAEYAGTEMLEHNNTRWFRKRDVKEYIRNRWDAYVNFFREDVHGNIESDTSLYKLRKLLCEEYWDRNDDEAYALSKETYFLLRLELSVVCEASLIYYKACYNLEGKKIIEQSLK